MAHRRGILALEDGTVFIGRAIGAPGTATGEVVFNTALSGYQEILTDPSYCGQIVVMTCPHIGNYGINPEDPESARLHLSGFVVKELSPVASNYRATGELDAYLNAAGVVGLAGIDTRALTRRIRVHGAMRGAISTEADTPDQLTVVARTAPTMVGANLVERVAPAREVEWSENPPAGAGPRVMAIDCGIKRNILRMLSERGCHVTAVPPKASAEAILERRPAGLLVGNGPGDPSAVSEAVELLRGLIGRVPIFGICLGHQLLALALGAKTYKLKFGHHGANHPVLNAETGRVEITSQNHGFAVDAASLAAVGARVSHTNLYDGSVEGFTNDDKRLFSVQYHPEAAPGPRDSRYLFDRFVELIAER